MVLKFTSTWSWIVPVLHYRRERSTTYKRFSDGLIKARGMFWHMPEATDKWRLQDVYNDQLEEVKTLRDIAVRKPVIKPV